MPVTTPLPLWVPGTTLTPDSLDALVSSAMRQGVTPEIFEAKYSEIKERS